MPSIITGYRVSIAATHASGQQQQFSGVVQGCDSKAHAIAVLAGKLDLDGASWQVQGSAVPLMARQRREE